MLLLYWKKDLVALFGNLIDSKSISIKKRMNENFCKNYQTRIINSFVKLNVPEFLDDRLSIGNAARYRVLFAGNIIRNFVDLIKKY